MQKHVELKYRKLKVKTYKKIFSSVEGLLMVNEGTFVFVSSSISTPSPKEDVYVRGPSTDVHLKGAEKAAVAIGVLAFIVIFAVVCWCFYKRHCKVNLSNPTGPNLEKTSPTEEIEL